MSDLSTLVDLERFSGFSLLEIEAVKTQAWPHVFGCDQPAWKCEACHEDLKAVRRVIAAVQPTVEQDHLVDLSAAGRLLPEGAERSTMFEVAWELVDGSTDGWGAASLADLRSRIARNGPPLGAQSGEIKAQESWEGPWSVVEPVAVKEASDG